VDSSSCQNQGEPTLNGSVYILRQRLVQAWINGLAPIGPLKHGGQISQVLSLRRILVNTYVQTAWAQT
jgi:hypothetical protein